MQPKYRDTEAMRQAEEEKDDEMYSQQAPYQRSRYVDDEAEDGSESHSESEEGEGDDGSEGEGEGDGWGA